MSVNHEPRELHWKRADAGPRISLTAQAPATQPGRNDMTYLITATPKVEKPWELTRESDQTEIFLGRFATAQEATEAACAAANGLPHAAAAGRRTTPESQETWEFREEVSRTLRIQAGRVAAGQAA